MEDLIVDSFVSFVHVIHVRKLSMGIFLEIILMTFRVSFIGTFKQDRITCQHLSMHLIQKKNEMVTWIDAMRSHPFYLAADVLQAALQVRDGPRMRDQ